MSQELFYTSAPRGLRPGSSGFCTVAATRGLSPALMERVEALSGYRHLFPPLDPRNPVVYAHARLPLLGKTYHVLSRIAAAGLDYSQRGNKFAHHVILEPGELPAGGPAWLLRQPGFIEQAWDGQVRSLEARSLPQGDAPALPCRAWQEVTGDAGWAGVLAEQLEKDSGRPVYLLFEPGLDLLPLVAEALALLPPERRWEVTFRTYFTGLPAGIACACRGVARHTDEAEKVARHPGAVVLDLAGPLGRAAGNSLVEQARTGRPPARPALAGPEMEWPEERRAARVYEKRPDLAAVRQPQPRGVPALTSGPAFAARPPSGPSVPPLPPPVPRQRAVSGHGTRQPSSVALPFAVGIAIGTLVTLACVAGSWYLGQRLSPTAPGDAGSQANEEPVAFKYASLGRPAGPGFRPIEPRGGVFAPSRKYTVHLLGLRDLARKRNLLLHEVPGKEDGSLTVLKGDHKVLEFKRRGSQLTYQWEKDAPVELQGLIENHTVLEIKDEVGGSSDYIALLPLSPVELTLPVAGASSVGLLTCPLGQGPLLAAWALFPGRTVALLPRFEPGPARDGTRRYICPLSRLQARWDAPRWSGFDLYLDSAELVNARGVEERLRAPKGDARRLESGHFILELGPGDAEQDAELLRSGPFLELTPRGKVEDGVPRLRALVLYAKIDGRVRVDVLRLEVPKQKQQDRSAGIR